MANNNWVLISLINSLILFVGLIYQIRIASLLDIPKRQVLIFICVISLIPATIFHSVGALKEIPTLVCILIFFYHYIKGQYIRWVIFATFLVLFRYQLIVVVFLFLFCDRFGKHSIFVAVLILVSISIFYPFISRYRMFYLEDTNFYRLGHEGTLGGFVEFVRGNIPVVSGLAVLVRVIQSIFQPLLDFIRIPSFYENGDLHVGKTAYLMSSVIMFPYWIGYLKGIIFLSREPFNYKKDAMRILCKTSGIYLSGDNINGSISLASQKFHETVMRLYLFGLLYIVPVGGFSFIGHRYLYPIMGIIMLSSAVCNKRLSLSLSKPRSFSTK
jgi:hypothetical protein